MLHSSKAKWRFIAMLAVFSLLVVACGDTSTETTVETADTTASTEGTTETTEAMVDDTTETTEAMAEVPTELAGLTVVDDKTFTVELSSADPEFPVQMNYAAYYALPDSFYDDPVAFEENPIGNGPFMVDGGWQHDVEVRTVPFAGYLLDDTPQVDSLTFSIYDSVDTAYLDLRAGNLDIVPSIPSDQIASAPAEFGDRYGESPASNIYYYGFPSYLWDTLTLDHRRALSMAVDRQLVIDAVLDGTRDPAYSLVPSILDGSRDFVCDNWSYNPTEAKAIWDAAGGWTADEFIVWFNSGSNHDQIADAIVSQWTQNLGLDASIVRYEQLEFSEYLPLIDGQGLTGLYRLGWGQDYPSPLNFIEPMYASYNFAPTGSNSSFYSNAEVDDLIDQGKQALAASGQQSDGIAFWQQAEDIICSEVPVMPIYFGKNLFAWSENVDNVTVDAYANVNHTTIQGGDVSMHINEPEHLNPLTSNESEGIEVLRAIFTPLIGVDPFTSEVYNAMAESFTSDDGGKTWTIVLADGWTFHDGTPVTAESYVKAWNYGALGANGMQNNSFYSNIVGYAEMNPPSEEG